MGEIKISRQGSAVTLELINHKKSNALDSAMLATLEQLVGDLEQDGNVRLLLIRGTQGGTFCGGADIKDWSAMTAEEFGRDWLHRGNVIFNRIEQLPFITVGVIEGLCLGGGLELALCADLRLASPFATFGFPEASIGAFPGWLGGPRMERLVGKSLAMEMVLLAQRIDALRAYECGLVNQVVPAEKLESTLEQLAMRANEVSGESIRACKGAFFAPDVMAYHAAAGARLRATSDAAEGLSAFFEKRKPNYQVSP